uniref:Uncharacterized protein n=1 Tax=Anguilla anguilla TaxID=7936 RepID=A0A0E9PPY8_ANGAN
MYIISGFFYAIANTHQTSHFLTMTRSLKLCDFVIPGVG